MIRFCSVLLLCLCLSQQALCREPALSDFAYALPLTVTDPNGLFTFIIPQQIYAKCAYPDLRDLRIFNGDAVPVPYAVRPMDAAIEKIAQALPFFILPSGREADNSDISLQVRRNSDGTVFTVNAQGSLSPSTAPAAFLLDASSHKAQFTELELELTWDRPGEGICTVSLNQSSDLVHWSTLVNRAVLADLRHQGQVVQFRSIPLAGKVMPYLRLNFLDCPRPPSLTGATALTGTLANPDIWHWLQLNPTAATDNKEGKTYTYTITGNTVTTALQIGLPAENSLVRAIIESRPTENSDWHVRAQGDFYRFNFDDQEQRNRLLPCTPTTDQNWRIRIIHDAAALGLDSHRVPALELGRKREQLIFLARGTGEYLVAYGSNGMDEDEPDSQGALLPILKDRQMDFRLQWIEPGPVRPLAGEAALVPRGSRISWKKSFLWGVLMLGVALLALMARTLFREMGTTGR